MVNGQIILFIHNFHFAVAVEENCLMNVLLSDLAELPFLFRNRVLKVIEDLLEGPEIKEIR